MPEHEPQEEKELNFRDLFIPLTNTKVIWFIIIIGLIVFGNGLFNSFVGDDMLQIIENPVIHSITHLPTFFSGGTFYNGGGQKLGGAFYRPITATLYSMTYTLFGSSAFAFHFVLMLLFIINACFLFLVFKQFFEKHLAFVLSLIFLVHPINSETALYVSDTQDVLFFFFGIVALWILQHYQSKKTFVAASFLLLFSLLSKETGILFLFITVAYIFICKRKYFSRWLASILPLIGVYVVLRISVIGLITKTIANAPIQKLDLLTRLINIPEVFLFYLKTFIFPVELSSSYQWVYTQIDFNHFFLPLLIDLLFLGGIVGSAVFLHKNYARKYFLHYVFFVMWFLCGILLHLQIIPLDKTVAVRWFYFPIVGILGMIGVLFEAFRVTTKNIWVLSIAFILIGLLATRTFIRTFDYRNELTLVRHDIPVSPDAYDLEFNLSYVYFLQGDFSDTKIHAQRSIVLFPNTGNYTSLGVAYFSLSDFKDAKDAFLKALHYGEYYETYENLAGLALFYGDPKENIDFIKNSALIRYPQDGAMWTDLAIVEYTNGEKDEAKNSIVQAYTYSHASLTSFAYDTIMTDKPLHLAFKNGQVTMHN